MSAKSWISPVFGKNELMESWEDRFGHFSNKATKKDKGDFV
jgi:hypothetical protein